MDAIAVRDLSKRYATRDGDVAARGGISLDIRAGDVVAVVGPSGCGKTTLLEKTVVSITHSIPEAVFLGDRVLVTSPPGPGCTGSSRRGWGSGAARRSGSGSAPRWRSAGGWSPSLFGPADEPERGEPGE